MIISRGKSQLAMVGSCVQMDEIEVIRCSFSGAWIFPRYNGGDCILTH